MDLDDVWVLEGRADLHLAEEAIPGLGAGRVLALEDLDGDLAIALQVLGEEDLAHATGS